MAIVTVTKTDDRTGEVTTRTDVVETIVNNKKRRSGRTQKEIFKPIQEVQIIETKPKQSAETIKVEQDLKSGTFSETTQPSKPSEYIADLRDRLYYDSQFNKNQFSRITSGTGSLALAGAQGVAQAGEGLYSLGKGIGGFLIANSSEKTRKLKSLGLGILAIVKNPKASIVDPLVTDFKYDPIGSLAKTGAELFTFNKLGKLAQFNKVKATASVGVSGASETKAFAGAEGVVKVKGLLKTKNIPFQSKEILNLNTQGSSIISKGERTLQIGKRTIKTDIRGISKITDQGSKSFNVAQTGKKSFGELTNTITKGETSISKTTILKQSGSKINNQFTNLQASKQIGKIGDFNINLNVGIGAKIKDIFKVVKNRFSKGTQAGNIQSTTSGGAGGTGLTTQSQQLKSSFISSFKTGSEFSAEQAVKATLSRQSTPFAIPNLNLKNTTNKATATQTEILPKKQTGILINAPATDLSQIQKDSSTFKINPNAEVIQTSDISIDTRIKPKINPPSQISKQDQAQVLSFDIRQLQDTKQSQQLKMSYPRPTPNYFAPSLSLGFPKFQISQKTSTPTFKRNNRVSLKQPKKYTPTTYSQVFNIMGKSSKSGETSGLGIRPIIQSKSKKRRREYEFF